MDGSYENYSNVDDNERSALREVYSLYLKSFRVIAHPLAIMKNWYDGSRRFKKTKFGSYELDPEYKEGRNIPYGFIQTIDPSIRSKLYEQGYTPKEQDREFLDHYNNYDSNILSTRGIHIKSYTLQYSTDNTPIVSNIKTEHPSKRQLTFFLDMVLSPKTYVKRLVKNTIYTKRNDFKLLNLFHTTHYDEYLTKEEKLLLDTLRVNMSKDIYTYEQGYTPSLRYMFTSIEWISKKVMGRSGEKDKTIRVQSKYIKQVPPYPFWHMYDYKIDSYLVDLREFMKYCDDIDIYSIDFSSYPFKVGNSVLPKGTIKFRKVSYSLEYTPKPFTWDDGTYFESTKSLDLSTSSKDSIKNVFHYRSDYEFGTNKEIIISDISTPLSIKLNSTSYSDVEKNLMRSIIDLGIGTDSMYKILK